jgi:hydroxypyruvate reductase
MAAAAEEMLGSRIADGVLVVKHGHTAKLTAVRQIEASHPVPDEAGVTGTRQVLDLVRGSNERTLVLCLLSGGGSALLVAPAAGLTLSDKQLVTDLLLKAGATIEELNAVRKHLSAVKGGRLAREAMPAAVVTLILSDVIGDRLDVIASGPTVPDVTTFADALSVIDRYGLRSAVPSRVSQYLDRGIAGLEPETLKAGDPCFHSVRNVIIGSNIMALMAASDQAREAGCLPSIISAQLQGDARIAAHELAARAKRLQAELSPIDRVCLLAGGETTVVVRGAGTGGRNQEMALAMALEIDGREGIAFLSAGTDGNDGPTDAAGAFVDGATAATARSVGLDPAAFLENNDSYNFFRLYDAATGGQSHLLTGPTGTNVMDLQYLLVQGRSRNRA